eukprot:scaffold31368_cov218-Isochrysis_galbana.AAC.1
MASGPRLASCLSRKLGELDDLLRDLPTSGQLPGEQKDADGVERDVCASCRVRALLHEWDERGGERPADDDAGAGIEVGAREELLRSEEGVNRALDRERRTKPQDDRADLRGEAGCSGSVDGVSRCTQGHALRVASRARLRKRKKLVINLVLSQLCRAPFTSGT